MAVPGIRGASHGLQNSLNHVPIVWLYQYAHGSSSLGEVLPLIRFSLERTPQKIALASFAPCRWKNKGQGTNGP